MSPSKRPRCEAAQASLLIDRREFARSGAVGALGAMAPIFGSLEFRGPGKEPKPEALSVGYLRGSGEGTSPGRLPWLTAGRAEAAEPQSVVAVIPARSLPSRARASETKPLRMTVHGLYPAVPAGSRLLSVWLDLLVPSPDPSIPDPVRFAAWSYASRPVPSASPGTSFVLPNGGLDGVTLVIETLERPFLRGFGVPSGAVPWDGQVPAPGTRRRHEARFHVSGSDGQLPLRRGTYLLGLTASTWQWPERLPGPHDAPRAELLSVAVSVRPEGEA